ncbi:ABC transporter permease, partial [Xanthovirga aplysinae]|uniref:ABC transporter permease n=1 Tax=Xanthovirga aplysinae TaxID=2529853 RepID=UPI0012BC0E6F
ASDPAKVLKGNFKSGLKGGKLRSTLVVIQFAVSIFLLVGTGVIYKQLNFIRNTNIGFHKEQLLTLHNTNTLGKQTHTFKEEMLQNALFKSGTVSGFLPVQPSARHTNGYQSKEQQVTNEVFVMERWEVDYDYLKTLGMEIVQGRFFSSDFPSDSSAIVVNESVVKKLGFKDPIGKTLMEAGNDKWYTIIGVVKNFNFESLRDKIGPLAMRLENDIRAITFRFEGKKASDAIALLKNQWKKIAPGHPFNYSFLDDRFNSMYRQEQKTGEIFAVFSCLAIFIACLGLFGLAAFTAEQRKKEIGVRKVLGASIRGIVLLLSKDFGKLLIIAFLVASPLAWWSMSGWLQNFHFHTSIGFEIFLVSGLLSFLVAWITMSYH